MSGDRPLSTGGLVGSDGPGDVVARSPSGRAHFGLSRADPDELVPLARRVCELDPAGVVRLRADESTIQLLVRLPFDVLVARTVSRTLPASAPANAPADAPTPGPDAPAPTRARFDHAVRAAELIGWFDRERPEPPGPRDIDWRGSLPPVPGWRRIDDIPEDVVRELVRAGARTLKQAAEREGVAGAAPRAAVSDALLDSVVLTVTSDSSPGRAEITLRMLSALTRMGFLARGSSVAVDLAGRWTRVAASFGSVYAERAGSGLSVIRS